MNNLEINSKVAANGVSCYFFICFSWLLLFNKTNENIDNDFVKSHIKSSSLIHFGFILTYTIFVHYGLFSGINIYSIGLNHIITMILLLCFFLILLIGAYKAHNKNLFIANDIITIINKENINKIQLIDINNDNTFNEKDKITILLAYIPFLGFYNYSKYKKNLLIKNITKLNLIITLILILLYINSYGNLSNLILLFYTIYIVFVGINLFTQNNVIQLNLNFIPTVNKLSFILKTTILYLKHYFKEDNEFKNFHELLNNKINNYKLIEIKEEQELKLLKNTKLAKFLIYIPFINLIFLFSKKTAQKVHIQNGLIITLLLLIILILNKLNYFNTNLYLLFIIPIIYGTGYLRTKLSYKMPIVYEISEFLVRILNLFIFKSKKINEIRKREEVVSLKVEAK